MFTKVGAAFDTGDVADFLQQCWLDSPGEEANFAWLLDNASIHRNPYIAEQAAKEGVPLIKNIVARPDLNGAEGLWWYAKRRYRSLVCSKLANGIDWDNEELVIKCVKEVPREDVKRQAANGLVRIARG